MVDTATMRRRPAQRTAASWRVALRVARRDALRNRGRSAGVFVMIMVPVLLVVAGATLMRTDQLSPVESLPRELGAADAWIQDNAAGWSVVQGPLPQDGWTIADTTRERPGDAPTTIAEVLGPGTRTTAIYESSVPSILSDSGSIDVSEADLADPLLKGMVRLREGRFPVSQNEAAVTTSVARRGAPIGTSIAVGRQGPLMVVGVVDQTAMKDQVFILPSPTGGRIDSLWASPKWLVTTPGGVSWPDVVELNTYGMIVNSRQVVSDPPQVAEASGGGAVIEGAGFGATVGLLLGLLVVMGLLEIVLLAGPAFAVGASRQTRALGLVAAQGGDRRDVRRIVLAQALIIGGLAVLTGAVLGILLPRLGYPWLVVATAGQVGPFEVPLTSALLAMAFGLVAALTAAMLPARAVARLSPVAALAGRRPRARARGWPSAAGVALVVLGAAVALLGGRAVDGTLAQIDSALVLVVVGSVLLIVGAVLLAPAAVTLLGSLASLLPTSMRYALRDMGRNQMRTSPAVAAVIAVVAGAMAVGIVVASTSASDRALYVPTGPQGEAVVTILSTDAQLGPATPQDWQLAEDAILAEVPGGRVSAVPAVNPVDPTPGAQTLLLSGSDMAPPQLLGGGGVGALGSADVEQPWYFANLLVGPAGVAAVADALDSQQRATAEEALAAGRAVLLTTWEGPDQGTLQLDLVSAAPEDYGMWQSQASIEVPADAVRVRGLSSPAAAILPEQVLTEAGIQPTISALRVSSPEPLSDADGADLQSRLNQTLLDAQLSAAVSVEQGYRPYLAPALIVLLVVAFALALVGSVTASLLSMSDARPDLVTLGEVGAAPRVRRRIAATYAVGISLLGALIGTAVGFVPGVAAVVLLQLAPSDLEPGAIDYWGNPIPDSFLAIPWLLVAGLVLAIPLLIGVLVFATTRSELPRRMRIE